jgi:hypothetical protein
VHCKLFQSLADGFNKLTREFEFQKSQAELVQRELVSKIDSFQRESAFEMKQMQSKMDAVERESAFEMKQMQHKSDVEMKQMQSKIHLLEQTNVQQSSQMVTMERELKISVKRDMESQFLDLERHYFRNLRSNADKHLQFARAAFQRNNVLQEQTECLTNELNVMSSHAQFLQRQRLEEARLNEDRERGIQQRSALKRKLDALGPLLPIPDFPSVAFSGAAVMQQEIPYQGSVVGHLPVRLPNVDPAAIEAQAMSETEQQQDEQPHGQDQEQQRQ